MGCQAGSSDTVTAGKRQFIRLFFPPVPKLCSMVSMQALQTDQTPKTTEERLQAQITEPGPNSELVPCRKH